MSSDKDNTQDEAPEKGPDVDFHGAAIIDENGKEVPITESMIKEACEQLDPGSTEVRIVKDEEE